MKFLPVHYVLYGLALVLFAGLCMLSYRAPVSYRTAQTSSLSASTTPMRYEVVTTLAKQELGLGGRSPIPDNYGMLFVFSKPEQYGFWMKDMKEPIDIIWLKDDGSILYLAPSVSPNTYPKPFYPPAPVRYVLETRAGYAAAHGWTLGTMVPLPMPYGSVAH